MANISKAFIDTNIWLDILLERPGFAETSKGALIACIEEDIVPLCAATSLTDIFYLATKSAGADAAYKAIDVVLGISRIAQVDADVCIEAVALEQPDYEDGIIAACALAEGADSIISRDGSAFDDLGIAKLSPGEFIELLGYDLTDL